MFFSSSPTSLSVSCIYTCCVYTISPGACRHYRRENSKPELLGTRPCSLRPRRRKKRDELHMCLGVHPRRHADTYRKPGRMHLQIHVSKYTHTPWRPECRDTNQRDTYTYVYIHVCTDTYIHAARETPLSLPVQSWLVLGILSRGFPNVGIASTGRESEKKRQRKNSRRAENWRPKKQKQTERTTGRTDGLVGAQASFFSN